MMRIVSCARLSPEKGLDRLINISCKLSLNDIDNELWIIGGGTEYNRLNNLIKENGMENQIKLLGFQENPYKFIKTADIYCSASSLEGFSLIMSEAIILGKPVVAINSCGTDELLENGEYGMLVENSDEALYNALKEIVNDKEIYEQYIQKSLKRQKFFNGNWLIDEMMNYLESFLSA